MCTMEKKIENRRRLNDGQNIYHKKEKNAKDGEYKKDMERKDEREAGHTNIHTLQKQNGSTKKELLITT